MTYADVVLEPTQRITRVEIINVEKKIKLRKAAGLSEVNTEIKVVGDKIGVEVMVKLC